MQALRKDVQRNRQRLVTAAREAFTAHGPDVSLDEIARLAGVGPTTLYRHFPEKDDLIEAVLDELISSAGPSSAAADEKTDPMRAFVSMFSDSCGITDNETEAFLRLAATSSRARAYAHRLIVELIGPVTARLRTAGGLRAGITEDDIAMFIRMTVSADDHAGRAKAVEVLLAGLTEAQMQTPTRRRRSRQ